MTKTQREFTGEIFIYVSSFNIITKMEPADKKLGWIIIILFIINSYHHEDAGDGHEDGGNGHHRLVG